MNRIFNLGYFLKLFILTFNPNMLKSIQTQLITDLFQLPDLL